MTIEIAVLVLMWYPYVGRYTPGTIAFAHYIPQVPSLSQWGTQCDCDIRCVTSSNWTPMHVSRERGPEFMLCNFFALNGGSRKLIYIGHSCT